MSRLRTCHHLAFILVPPLWQPSLHSHRPTYYSSPTIPHSHTAPSLAPKAHGHRTHSRRAPSLQLHDAAGLRTSHLEDVVCTPVTPGYRFGVDEHFASHLHGHTPNLHDHSHVHGSGHSREGHSHNMRGLFLHVMAVSGLPSPISPCLSIC